MLGSASTNARRESMSEDGMRGSLSLGERAGEGKEIFAQSRVVKT